MELNSRCTQLLRLLAASEAPVPAGELAARLGLSRRALHYDLAKVSDWLELHGLGRAESGGKGLCLEADPVRREQVKALLDQQQRVPLSVEQRRALELLSIACGPGPVTAEAMMGELDVSRNTVLGDMREQKSALLASGLSLRSTAKEGYVLSGDEIALRRTVSRGLYALITAGMGDLPRRILSRALDVFFQGTGIDYYALVRKGLADYERALSTCLVSVDAGHEVLMTIFSAVRVLRGFPCRIGDEEKQALESTPQFSAAPLIISYLQELDVRLPVGEPHYLTILYLGVKNYDFDAVVPCPNFIMDFTVRLVVGFERAACVSFSSREQLISRLFLHVQPMYYRVKYGVRLENPLAHTVQAMYAWTYRFTQRALAQAGGEIPPLMSEDEIAYLCIYMGSTITRWDKHPMTEKRKALIICGAGVAASVLLREQMAELLGDALQYVLVPAARLAGEPLEAYSLFVSTVPFTRPGAHVIRTGPVLSDENRSRIVDAVMDMGDFLPERRDAARSLDIVRQHAVIQDEEALRRELFCAALKSAYLGAPGPAPQLAELLHRQGTVLTGSADTEARLLEELSAKITGEETLRRRIRREMLEHLHPGREPKASPFFLHDGVVLEYCHAGRIDARVLLLPRRPDLFGTGPVSAVILLSVVDNAAHMPLLGELYQIFSHPDTPARLDTLLDGRGHAEREMLQWLDWN